MAVTAPDLGTPEVEGGLLEPMGGAELAYALPAGGELFEKQTPGLFPGRITMRTFVSGR